MEIDSGFLIERPWDVNLGLWIGWGGVYLTLDGEIVECEHIERNETPGFLEVWAALRKEKGGLGCL